MNYEKSASLSAYLLRLLAAGRVVFTADEATRELKISHGAFLDAAERLQRRHALLSPRQGFYVVVPPQYAAWQAPPPDWYIDALMRHEGAPYYVALLKAAELHGATHQAVMEFQLISTKRLPAIRAGRSRLAFYYRKNMGPIVSGIVPWKTDTGYMHVSSPALTALDLLRYPQACGGLDHVATVLTELAPRISAEELVLLSPFFETPVVQRLGYLLDSLGHGDLAESMAPALRAKRSLRRIELEPTSAAHADLMPPVIERNARWQVAVRRYPQAER
jgi:predicted transcriptional regulator of viral defense system